MRRLLKILGWILAALIVLLVIAFAVFYFLSNDKLNEEYDIEVAALDIPNDEESIAEGQRLFRIRLCAECHGGDAGGDELIDDFIFARLYAPNLTNGDGGVAGEYESEDWVRAIRHGVRPSGKPLMIMPAELFGIMRNDELARIIAYLENADPVDDEVPERSLGPLGRVIVVLDPDEDLPVVPAHEIDHDAVEPSTVEVGATVEYGAYITEMSCEPCHGSDLKGDEVDREEGGTIQSANLVQLANDWTYEQFVETIKTGTDPEGDRIDDAMPWENLAFMNDTEFEAIWAYLESLES